MLKGFSEDLNSRVYLVSCKSSVSLFVCPKLASSVAPTGLPVSTYAKFCHRKLLKVAITGGKKVSLKKKLSFRCSRSKL